MTKKTTIHLNILKRTKNNNIHVYTLYTCTLSTYTMHVFTYYLVLERSLGLLCTQAPNLCSSWQVVASTSVSARFTRCWGPSVLLQKFVKADPKMDKDWKESDHSAQLHLNRTFNHQKYHETQLSQRRIILITIHLELHTNKSFQDLGSLEVDNHSQSLLFRTGFCKRKRLLDPTPKLSKIGRV